VIIGLQSYSRSFKSDFYFLHFSGSFAFLTSRTCNVCFGAKFSKIATLSILKVPFLAHYIFSFRPLKSLKLHYLISPPVIFMLTIPNDIKRLATNIETSKTLTHFLLPWGPTLVCVYVPVIKYEQNGIDMAWPSVSIISWCKSSLSLQWDEICSIQPSHVVCEHGFLLDCTFPCLTLLALLLRHTFFFNKSASSNAV